MLHHILIWSLGILAVLSYSATVYSAFSRDLNATIRYLGYACAAMLALWWVGVR